MVMHLVWVLEHLVYKLVPMLVQQLVHLLVMHLVVVLVYQQCMLEPMLVAMSALEQDSTKALVKMKAPVLVSSALTLVLGLVFQPNKSESTLLEQVLVLQWVAAKLV